LAAVLTVFLSAASQTTQGVEQQSAATKPVGGEDRQELFHLWPLDKPIYIDRQGKIVLEVEGDGAAGFSGGLAGIRIGYKWGFIDTDGKTVIEPQFDRVGRFSGGLAPADFGEKWGYIDRSGKTVIPPRFNEAWSFHGGVALVNVGEVFNFHNVPKMKKGFIDRTGKWIAQPKYRAANAFRDGLARVWSAGENGLIDRTGRLVLDLAAYGSTEPFFSEGLIAVEHAGRGYGYIDLKENWVIRPRFDTAGCFSEGMAAVGVAQREALGPSDDDGPVGEFLYGYVNRKGEIVVAAQYAEAEEFHEGLARVRPRMTEGCYGRGDRWGYIDRGGHLVIPLKYNEATDFHRGLAWVHYGGRLEYVGPHFPPQWEGGQWLLIDRQGNAVWSQPREE
jgi:hypothetical protein